MSAIVSRRKADHGVGELLGLLLVVHCERLAGGVARARIAA
jgi:hypothetical protein